MLSRPEELLKKGFAFPCTVCAKMWRALDRGAEVCEASMTCGGPMMGKSFPDYEGVLNGSLVRFCFRCGRQASKLVSPPDGGYIGVCDEHIKMLDVSGGL